MIKAGEEVLRLQEENQKLGAKVYSLSSQIISLEQDKIDLTNEIKGLKEGIAKAREEMDNIDLNEYADNTYQLVNECIDILKRYTGESNEL